MKNNEKRGISITSMLILFALVPLTVTAIILVVISSVNIVNSIKTNTREELEVASQALRDYYEYDIINNIDLVDGFCEYDTTYIDKIKNRGIDLTLFKENIRFMTTIKDDSGKRIEGTKASDEVWKIVSSGKEYYSDDVVINGKDYYLSDNITVTTNNQVTNEGSTTTDTPEVISTNETKEDMVWHLLVKVQSM